MAANVVTTDNGWKIQLKKSHVPDNLASVTTRFSQECTPESVGIRAKHVEAIWRNVEALYRTGVYPGISFCLRRHGEIVLNRGIGHRRGNGPDDDPDGPKELMTADTPICLFSASKVVTAMLIHGLAERGELNLMDPVSYYMPKFAVTGKGDLTIHHILTHRAGIPLMPQIEDESIYLDPQRLSEIVHGLEPRWVSGRSLGYHAVTGGFVLGEIARKVTGMDMRELQAELIQKPLGLKYFNFGVEKEDFSKVAQNYYSGVVPSPFVEGFLKRLLGMPVPKVVELSNDSRFQEAIIPAGNIMSTAEEVSRFFQVLLNMGEFGGKRIFESLSVRRAIQEVGKPEFDRMFLAPMRYSAGFMLGSKPLGLWGPNTQHAFGHIGFTNNLCWADRQRDISVAFLGTGNPLIGPHLPALVTLLTNIGRYCKPVVKI